MIIYRKMTGREMLKAEGCLKHNRIKAYKTDSDDYCLLCLEHDFPGEYAHFITMEEKNNVSAYVQAQENYYHDNRYAKIK